MISFVCKGVKEKMCKKTYVEEFEQRGFGLFVHFGLYSVVGKGEWYYRLNKNCDPVAYRNLMSKFVVKRDWATRLVAIAKKAGCKYITLTARHHDGYSLYDTCGLNDYDAPHSACGRDLVAEFVDACNKGGVAPFFYHTWLDWCNADYTQNFPKYIDYLNKSIEILCTKYGKIGGFWFDGAWDQSTDWHEDEIYGTIRKYQPHAIIVNNTGLSELGKTGHPQIDCVTFERGNPFLVSDSRSVAGEMCQVLNDHWGYAATDIDYKPVSELIGNLVECRACNCNLLLNTGLKGDGTVRDIDKCILTEIGKWIRANKNFVYIARHSAVTADNATVLTDGTYLYAVVRNVPVSGDENVNRRLARTVVILDGKIKRATWLDNGEAVELAAPNAFVVKPFDYGTSGALRVAKIKLK